MPSARPALLRLLVLEKRPFFLCFWHRVFVQPPAPGEYFFRLAADGTPRPLSKWRLKAVAKRHDVFAWPPAGIPVSWQIPIGRDDAGPWVLRILGRLRVTDRTTFAVRFAPLAAQCRVLDEPALREILGASVEAWLRASIEQVKSLPEYAEGNQIDPDMWRFRFDTGSQELPFERNGLVFVPYRVQCCPESQLDAHAPPGRRLLSHCADKHGEDRAAVRIEKTFARRGTPLGPLSLKAPALRQGDSLEFVLSSARAGVVTLLNVDPSGAVVQLLPSGQIPGPRIAAGGQVPVGNSRSPWISDLREGDPSGNDALLAIVSDRPVLPVRPSGRDGSLSADSATALLARLETLPPDAWSADTLEFEIV